MTLFYCAHELHSNRIHMLHGEGTTAIFLSCY
jgi:hypothetical protein